MANKLKVELEAKRKRESQILGHLEDTALGIESICELKDFKNFEVGLFGISKKTEHEYISNLNQARQNLFSVFFVNSIQKVYRRVFKEIR